MWPARGADGWGGPATPTLARHPGRIELKTTQGLCYVPVDSVAAAELPRFFPEQVAARRAARDLRKTLAALAGLDKADTDEAALLTLLRFGSAEDGVEQTAVGRTSPVTPAGANPPPLPVRGRTQTGAPATAVALRGDTTEPLRPTETTVATPGVIPEPMASGRSEPVVFDVTPGRSPDFLQPVLKDFGRWLEMQQRRMGGAVAASANARRQGHACVLYVRLSPLFLRQDYDFRFQVLEGMWNFWAFRCLEYGTVAEANDAYVVLVTADGRLVGGSKPHQGSTLWVAGGKSE